MKAIQVKILSPTNSKGTRIKAWIKGTSVVKPFHYNIEHGTDTSKDIATKLMDKLGWSDTADITGIGCLPNGDYCVTIKNKVR